MLDQTQSATRESIILKRLQTTNFAVQNEALQMLISKDQILLFCSMELMEQTVWEVYIKHHIYEA